MEERIKEQIEDRIEELEEKIEQVENLDDAWINTTSLKQRRNELQNLLDAEVEKND